MKKKKVLNSLKDLSKFLLVNERINSQRCVAQNIDTTKTIIENKEENTEENNENSTEENKENSAEKNNKESNEKNNEENSEKQN